MKPANTNHRSDIFGKVLLSVLLAVSCILGSIALGRPQDGEEDSTRRLWNMQFKNAREGKKKPVGNAAKESKASVGAAANDKGKPAASIPTPTVAEEPVAEELVGLTVWRLREAKPVELKEPSRLLQQNGSGGEKQFAVERIGGDAVFTRRDKVRLGFEVPRAEDSYLYIVDQEVYADGSVSDPYLVFPLSTTRNGDNVAKAGKIIEIPARTDETPYFDLSVPTLREGRVKERLTVILTSQPLDLPLTNTASKLELAQLQAWEKKWGGVVEMREAKTKQDNQWTPIEKEAGEGRRLLQQGDPLPHTIYHIKTPANNSAVLFQLTISVKP